MQKRRLIVFASGTESGGGSGFENLVIAQREDTLFAEIVAVASSHWCGGVHKRAMHLAVPFRYFGPPWTAERYQQIVNRYKADFVVLSGWLKLVRGLDPKKTFNVHPGPLPEFGGRGMYGRKVHEAVMRAFNAGEVSCSAVSMHFVTEEYDKGPVFFHYEVPIFPGDTAQALAVRVNRIEHKFQPMVTDMVLQGLISWDGQDTGSLRVPATYSFLPKRAYA